MTVAVVPPPPAAAAAAAQAQVFGISGSADSTLAFFTVDLSAATLTCTAEQKLPTAGVAEVAVRSDGRVAASAHWDGRVRLWHARKRVPLGVLRYHSKAAAAVAFAPAGQMQLASGGRDGAVAIWDVFPPERS